MSFGPTLARPALTAPGRSSSATHAAAGLLVVFLADQKRGADRPHTVRCLDYTATNCYDC